MGACCRGYILTLALLELLALTLGARADTERPVNHIVPSAAVERGDHAITIYLGQSSPDTFSSIIFKPYKTNFEDTYLVAMALSTKLFDIGEHLDIELEGSIVRRFGDDDNWEFNASLFIRWDNFPWQDFIYTTAGLGLVGPSYATGISETERRKSGNDSGSKFLNYFAPEITFSPPSNHNIAVILRLHHRSGAFGLFDGVDGGSSFVSVGFRHYF